MPTARLGVAQSAAYEAEIADVGVSRGVRQRCSSRSSTDTDQRLRHVRAPGSPLYEVDDPDGATIRMLGVAATARGQGIGEALARACVERARAAGARRIWLHTEPFMQAAHRLYERLGFVRAPEKDWRFEEEGEPDVILLAYVLESVDPASCRPGSGLRRQPAAGSHGKASVACHGPRTNGSPSQ